ncbi:threonine-phosphate decarboxylase CobD [Caulobacter sp. NIBR2454]|uniref:threonine-phosphate decarboxylase CobD n=1 Tax=Caulobacter sp. NIBR2454 TaxID=3015996 RepID=UPI0022B71D45|nr:threonine-phosphate decarboxylase CobD [Caulobacter sp. NIBR2454]
MTAIHGFSRHGGRLAQARAAYPHAPLPWIDLSTGINPHPWTGRRAMSADLARLPDPIAVAALEASAGRVFGLSDPDRIAAVAGAEVGLRLLPMLTRARSVAIVGPTYSGHAEAWTGAGVRVIEATLDAIPDADAVVIVNPNNPDGSIASVEFLIELAQRQAARAGWLIVDESFVETTPDSSIAAQAGGALIVLRSFGKFYGLAGVRLGFVLADPELITHLKRLTGDWPISAEAIAAGAAYDDPTWADAMRVRLARDARKLDRVLIRAGLSVVGGTDLFRLAHTPKAADLFDHLCRSGILTRPFAEAPDRLRFGIPPRGAWKRLEQALEAA